MRPAAARALTLAITRPSLKPGITIQTEALLWHERRQFRQIAPSDPPGYRQQASDKRCPASTFSLSSTPEFKLGLHGTVFSWNLLINR
jgi:hypothetical protein